MACTHPVCELAHFAREQVRSGVSIDELYQLLCTRFSVAVTREPGSPDEFLIRYTYGCTSSAMLDLRRAYRDISLGLPSGTCC